MAARCWVSSIEVGFGKSFISLGLKRWLWLLSLPAQCLLINLNRFEVVMVTHSSTLTERGGD